MFNFDDSFYNLEIHDDKVVGVKNPKVWQNIVLHGLVLTHYLDKRGGYYLESPIVVDYSKPLYRMAIREGYNINNNDYFMTNHYIRIGDVWSYVNQQLSLYDISYISGDADFDNCLESLVVKYLEYLCTNNYLLYMNTRMGHNDELAYKLSEPFRKYVEYVEPWH